MDTRGTEEILAIGVDIGGSKLAAGAVGSGGALLDYAQCPLPDRDYGALLQVIAGLTARLSASCTGEPPLGVAIAGWLSADREQVVAAANLGWQRRPLRRDLAARTGLRTVVHNDANAAAWGEYVLAGRPENGAFVALTLGTDVGGGIIVDGRLLTGAFGLAGELGHLQVNAEGPACVCGGRGCLAVYASGKAMLDRARQAVAQGSAAAAELSSLCGGDPARLTGEDLASAARREDPATVAIVADAAAAIAAASAVISRVVDHHTLVLGGGASAIGQVLALSVTRALGQGPPVGPVLPVPAVRLARAGNKAGVLGAADLAATAG